MKKYTILFLVLFFGTFTIPTSTFSASIEENIIEPIIDAEESFPTGKKIIFDASKSKIFDTQNNAKYSWNFGDESPEMQGKEVVHSFSSSGTFQVTLRITQLGESHTSSKKVHVYDTRAIFITKESLIKELDSVFRQARSSGVFIEPFFLKEDMSIAEQKNFVSLLRENNQNFEKADMIIFYSESAEAVQLFTNFWNSLSNNNRFSLEDTLLIHISKSKSQAMQNLLKQSFHLLDNKEIYTTRPYALEYILTAKETTQILNEFKNNSVEFERIDAENTIPFYLVFSQITSYLTAAGISYEIILLLLSFPFITFFIALFRQFVGVSTFGVFIPAILTLSFQLFGIFFILGVIGLILIVGLLLNLVFKRLEILTIPRVAFSLGILTFPFFGMLFLNIHYHWEINFTHAIFPMIVMSMVAEKFMAVHLSDGGKNALFATMKTIIVSLIAFWFVEYEAFQSMLLSLPEIVFLPMIFTVLLGRFTGLRLTEYWRFRSLLQEGVEE